jgi:two-component system KDP operon response regulator KdpE
VPDAPVRILLLEDEALNRSLIRATLARGDDDRLRGAELVEAATVREARDALAHETFDLLLLDVRLPDGDGLELAASIPSPQPIMVALTASVVPSPTERAAQVGCQALLPKPFQPAELRTLLTRLLDQRSAARESLT